MLERELSRWRSLKVDPPAEWRGAWVIVHQDDPPAPCESLAEAYAAHAALFGASPALIRRLPGGDDGAPRVELDLGDGPARFAAAFACPRDGATLDRDCRIDYDALQSALDAAAILALELPVIDVGDDGAAVYGAFVALSAPETGGAIGPVRLAARLRTRPAPPGAVLGREFLADNRARLRDGGRRLALGPHSPAS